MGNSNSKIVLHEITFIYSEVNGIFVIESRFALDIGSFGKVIVGIFG